jgi:hypothetical protein
MISCLLIIIHKRSQPLPEAQIGCLIIFGIQEPKYTTGIRIFLTEAFHFKQNSSYVTTQIFHKKLIH